MKLVIASDNAGKIREFKQLLSPSNYDYEVLSQSEVGFDIKVEETGKTFEENAVIKATALFTFLKTRGESDFIVIADDSGLEVDKLGGEPGVYSARYAPEGQRKQTILTKLEGVPLEERTARFVCSICCIDSSVPKNHIKVSGECEGYIGFECKGENGFGYDPIFMVGEESFAEIDSDRKNEISHRGIALRKLAERLNQR
ncbi:MAG: RdgB/HAM1 family non-canonical purine NTP pyrophosphatase [Oscillospiraceae bacterium]|nr:RdgB/HAM1 family non-canonical purine NTP pyrophosphatase [Oscillospiraceae bacterium]